MRISTLLSLQLLLITPVSYAQAVLKLHAAATYLEHFSVGTSFEWRDRHNVCLRYGSNMFYKPQDFSTFFIQYGRSFLSSGFAKLKPAVGVKAGYTIFTDEYYNWNIVSVVPIVGLKYELTERVEVTGESGVAISRIQSVTRRSFGEIGKYKRYLPEVGIALRYTLFALHR